MTHVHLLTVSTLTTIKRLWTGYSATIVMLGIMSSVQDSHLDQFSQKQLFSTVGVSDFSIIYLGPFGQKYKQTGKERKGLACSATHPLWVSLISAQSIW